jgi:hypothetical protein
MLSLSFISSSVFATDFCVSGLKGTLSSAYVIKVTHPTNSDRLISLLDTNKTSLFSSKAENRFTQFNSTGYGVCSLTASGTDLNTSVQYKLELKVAPHSKSECNLVDVPVGSEYFTLKIIPKGTTLGDDLTAYALAPIPCPE